MWSPENKERNKKIMEMIKDHSIGEIADTFGISRQRVDQIVNEHGGYPIDRTPHQRGNKLRAMQSGLLMRIGKKSDREIGEEFGLTTSSVRIVRIKAGVHRFESNPIINGKLRCYRCRQNVPLKDMVKDRRRPTGYQPICKKCMRERAEIYRHAKSSLRP